MNIRKFWRLSCLTVASLFWASCSESNPHFPIAQSANPDSSADAIDGNSSSDAALSESSSSSVAEENISSSDRGASSSSDAAMSSSNVESSSSVDASSASSSSETVKYVLARDTSVTCEKSSYKRDNCPEPSYSPTCDDYKTYLGKDTTVSEKLLTSWEEKLKSCGAIREPEPVYGIVSPVCVPVMFYDAPMFKCSNNMTYKNYKLENNLVYTSSEEYDEAHGIFPEDLVKSCKQDEFALFTDILADVQKKLYEVVSGRLMEDIARPEAEQNYLESLLDRENKTLKGPFSPYLPASYKSDSWLIKEKSSAWFTGYVAKTKACEGGDPATTEIYQQKYDAILAECLELIEKNSKNTGD